MSSIIVGELWAHVSATAGFAYGAVFTLLGAAFLLLVPNSQRSISVASA
jgi:hypothetical protein